MAELPVSSSSLPLSGGYFLDVSFETPQSTGSIEFSQPILPSIQPLATRSPLDEPVEFNWPPSSAWSSFGEEGEFPPLTSGSPFVAAVVPPSPRSIFEDLTEDSYMDSSSPIGSDGMPVSTREYQLFPEDISHASVQYSSPTVSLLASYRSLGQIMSGVASIAQSSIVTPPWSLVQSSSVPLPSESNPSVIVTSVPVQLKVCVDLVQFPLLL